MAEDYDLKTEVAIIKRDISAINSFSAKIDDAIEKMAEVSNSISKMLIMHDNKLQNHDQLIDGLKMSMSERKSDFEKQVELLHKRISDMKDENHVERQKNQAELLAAIKAIGESVSGLDERITSLEQWKWWLLGAAAVIGLIMSQIPWNSFFHFG